MDEAKDKHLIIVSIVAIVAIVGIVLGIFGINKISIPSQSTNEEQDLVGGATATTTCTDTENGNLYFTKKGTVTKDSQTYTDTCKNGILIDYNCVGNFVDSATVRCICQNDGACANSDRVFCEDSDGGVNIFVRGFVKSAVPRYLGTFTENPVLFYADYCINNTLGLPPGEFVSETFCEGGYFTATTYICPNGCKNGACIQ